MRRNPYVFVVGCPRSGTTLLQRMLDNHPQLAVANDTHFIPQVIREFSKRIDPPLTPDLVEAVRQYKRFPRLGLNDEAVSRAAQADGTYGGFVSRLYSEFARMNGKPLGGEKTPDYVRKLPRLHGLFPWARIVHIIRDGRDVALSNRDWATPSKGPGRIELWAEEPIAVSALWWRWQVGTGRCDGESLGPDLYLEVRYEELVAQPEAQLRRIAAFLDLPFTHEMVTFYEGKTRAIAGLSAKTAWLPATRGVRDWRTQLPERDVALFEVLAADLLGELNYPLSDISASPELIAVGECCRAWWNRHLPWRQTKREDRHSLLAVTR